MSCLDGVEGLLAQKLLVVPETSHQERTGWHRKEVLPRARKRMVGVQVFLVDGRQPQLSAEKLPKVTWNVQVPSYQVPEAAEASSASSSASSTPHSGNDAPP